MGDTTKIAWTGSTINVWHGCEKVDTLCKHCYAEVATPVRVKRAGGLELWGGSVARSETKSWWRDLARWNAAALTSGKVHRVFGQSLSDTFEDYSGSGVRLADGTIDDGLDGLRDRFFHVVGECSALTFQLLTKRPENVCRMVPASWLEKWPAHVQIGTSVGDQASADLRIPHLLRVPAAVRFLSVEPQVGPLLLDNGETSWLTCNGEAAEECCGTIAEFGHHFHGIDWVIQGGESGSKARPFDLGWARSLRDQCRAAGVPYFLKQLGARPHGHARPPPGAAGNPRGLVQAWHLRDSHGGDEAEWPEDLRGCRAFPAEG